MDQAIEIQRERTGLPVHTASYAVHDALAYLSAHRVGIVTPFDDAGNELVRSVYEDRGFTARGDGSQAPVLDHESSKPEKTDPAVIAQLDGLDISNGDSLIAFGWAMAEDLEKLL